MISKENLFQQTEGILFFLFHSEVFILRARVLTVNFYLRRKLLYFFMCKKDIHSH